MTLSGAKVCLSPIFSTKLKIGRSGNYPSHLTCAVESTVQRRKQANDILIWITLHRYDKNTESENKRD